MVSDQEVELPLLWLVSENQKKEEMSNEEDLALASAGYALLC